MSERGLYFPGLLERPFLNIEVTFASFQQPDRELCCSIRPNIIDKGKAKMGASTSMKHVLETCIIVIIHLQRTNYNVMTVIYYIDLTCKYIDLSRMKRTASIFQLKFFLVYRFGIVILCHNQRE